MAEVTLKNIKKSFGPVDVIKGVDLDILDKEFVVFVGPSGCGKSTLLRLIAGLEDITSGDMYIGDKLVNEVDPASRGVAMVFQSYALYPHMSVRRNMGFGLKMNGMPQAEIDQRVNDAARILQLDQLLDRKPKALSGGQRQRVAIGRAIVREPKVFLFDEPLSNLDAELRVQMRVEIGTLHKRLQTTMIYVTHDQTEAMTMADKIVVLRAGLVEQVGSPLELYNNPRNQFVAGFIGSPKMNFDEVTISADEANRLRGEGYAVARQDSAGNPVVTLGVRPEHIIIGEGEAMSVVVVEHLGGLTYLHCDRANGTRFVIETEGQVSISDGDEIRVSFPEDRLHRFDDNGRTILAGAAKAIAA